MLSLLPHKTLKLESPFSQQKALAALASTIKPRRSPWTFQLGDGTFTGTLTDGYFEIRRDIGYRNSFLPMIKGTIAPSGGGSIISAEMRLHPFIRFFMFIWLSGAAFGLLTLTLPLFHHMRSEDNILGYCVPPFMLLFGFALMYGCFYPEARIAENFLRGTFKTDPEISY